MFYTDVDALLNVTIADDLVNNNTNGMGSDIIHDSSPSVKQIGGR